MAGIVGWQCTALAREMDRKLTLNREVARTKMLTSTSQVAREVDRVLRSTREVARKLTKAVEAPRRFCAKEDQ